MKVVYWPQRSMTFAERSALAVAGKALEGVVVPLQGGGDPGEWLVAGADALRTMGDKTNGMVWDVIKGTGAGRVWVQLWAATNTPKTQLIDVSDPAKQIETMLSIVPKPQRGWSWLLDCELYPYCPPASPGHMAMDAWAARHGTVDPYPFATRQSVYCWMRDMAPMTIAGSDQRRRLREGFRRYLKRGSLTPPEKDRPALCFTLDTCEADDPQLRFQRRHLKGSLLQPCPGTYAGTAPTAKSLTASLRRIQDYGAQYAYIYDCENELCTASGAKVLLAAVRAVA